MWHRTIPASAFPAALADLAAAPPPRVALFTASPDPVTRLPWCPDCVRSAPAVRAGVAAAGGSLLEVEVDRAAWKGPAGPAHPLRAAPHAVTGLPTLVAYDREGGEVGRVGGELERAADENAARAVVEAWVSGLKAG